MRWGCGEGKIKGESGGSSEMDKFKMGRRSGASKVDDSASVFKNVEFHWRKHQLTRIP
jgi:hypothetical protein